MRKSRAKAYKWGTNAEGSYVLESLDPEEVGISLISRVCRYLMYNVCGIPDPRARGRVTQAEDGGGVNNALCPHNTHDGCQALF